MPVCASGDRRRNVACVLGCAEVRGLPARQIKSGWFPRRRCRLFNNCVVYSLSVSLNLHDINKSSGRTAHRQRVPPSARTHPSRRATLSTICAPMNRLRPQHTEWIWSTECDKAFHRLKEMLAQKTRLVHYDQTSHCRLPQMPQPMESVPSSPKVLTVVEKKNRLCLHPKH